MTSGRVEVITSVQRRRRWSQAEKERIVAAALEPDAVASAVARAAGIHVSQLFRWRRELCEARQPARAFTAVRVIADSTPVVTAGTIEVEFANGTRLRVIGAVDAGTISATLMALVQGERRR
jgi:transposase